MWREKLLMSRFRAIPYKPDHFDLLEIRERELINMSIMGEGKQRLTVLSQSGNCFTTMYKGKIIGVVGWFEMWPTVCEVFILPTIYIGESSLIFAKAMKNYLHSFEKLKKYKRVQVTAVNDKLHCRWLSWLEFNKEGILKNYGPNGEDCLMWARYSDD